MERKEIIKIIFEQPKRVNVSKSGPKCTNVKTCHEIKKHLLSLFLWKFLRLIREKLSEIQEVIKNGEWA